MCCPLRDGWKRLPLGSLSRGVDDYHTKAAKGFANAFKESGSARDPQAPKSQPNAFRKRKRVEEFTTLKQACPSECQGAQGAFKDSMIH